MINRKEFSPGMSVEEFDQHYWYKEELKQICMKHSLSSHGTKAELQEKIRQYLSGEVVIDKRKKHSNVRKSAHNHEITLHTRLIPEGFKFNDQAREFFMEYYHVSKFSFTKDMAAALRDAEKRGDLEMTVADLIKVYEESKLRKKTKKAIDSAEEKTYQWNNFVREFNQDPRSKNMKNKMKVAALLWRYVKNNPGSKEYRHDLLQRFEKDVKKITSVHE
ncbi:SAP domain-containing protein [Caldalkalibacillus salinus]|uniref:SAP domain-containing protein n=1 Tax=Caldalkalibacillus salinus TaxID=2803787 RepID=UPI001922B115|nr:SAP domain-containing protein [Caldalkalibacillus salinus]